MKKMEVAGMTNNLKYFILLPIILLCHGLCYACDIIDNTHDAKGIAAMDTIRDTTDKIGYNDAVAAIEKAGYTIIDIRTIDKGKKIVITGVKRPSKSCPSDNLSQSTDDTTANYEIYEGQIIRKDGSIIITRSYVKDGELVRKTIDDEDIPIRLSPKSSD